MPVRLQLSQSQGQVKLRPKKPRGIRVPLTRVKIYGALEFDSGVVFSSSLLQERFGWIVTLGK